MASPDPSHDHGDLPDPPQWLLTLGYYVIAASGIAVLVWRLQGH